MGFFFLMTWFYFFFDYGFRFFFCVILKLNPKKLKFKKFFKFRKARFNFFLNFLHFGNCGLLILRPITITTKKLVKIILLIKKATKRSSQTRRLYWFYCFPHFPLTRKPINSRMGKGKGKPKKWFAQIKPGSLLFELKNVRIGRAIFFIKKTQRRFKTPTALIFNFAKFINFPFYISKKARITLI